MSFIKHKQIKPLKKKVNEFELTPLVESTEKLVRKICKCPTKLKESIQDSSKTSIQPRFSCENSGQPTNEAPRDNSYKVETLEDSLPRFGPLLLIEQPSVLALKEKAWEHVLKNSSEDDPAVTKEVYYKAIRKVEQRAMEIYADKVQGTNPNFRWMMIKDGCFFLQLALWILGCSEQLKYPSNDPIFGNKHSKKEIKKWIEAMFFVGNQIPFVVLRELMKQRYFQDVIKNVEWNPPPSGLCKKVFYELLVLPARKKKLLDQDNRQQPCDLLHCLHITMIGDDLFGVREPNDDIDLEADEDEIDDYEANITAAIDDDNETLSQSNNIDRIRKILNAIGFSSAIDNRKRIFPCAMELERGGIKIKKLNGGGVKSIDFKSYYFSAYLYLPAFPVDDNAEMIFRNLKNYEISQQMGKHKREASSYLRFMSDIIQTTKDVKLLLKKGVIQGDSDDAEKLPRILRKLSSEDVRLTHEFHILRRKLRDYSSPWIHYKGVVNLVVFLTLLQTFFTLLAYFKPPKP
ncbi:hypothetical protein CDL12_08235 [Handroanthus impetiginosus]|uniref:Uncharacterized protein n=1 Tax=Handroanthus impetiginosus TaxID=429701 RepID=A0A2G9HP69_9LAMI|nr:hypothetical protein CDL12_08235 [Handroanthus impetiginosus]